MALITQWHGLLENERSLRTEFGALQNLSLYLEKESFNIFIISI